MLYQTVSRLPGTRYAHRSAYADTRPACEQLAADMRLAGFECEIVPAAPGVPPYPAEPDAVGDASEMVGPSGA